jgi:hypothetical protein
VGKKNEDRVNVSRQKKEYFVNAIDVAEDIKQSVPLVTNYSFLNWMYF